LGPRCLEDRPEVRSSTCPTVGEQRKRVENRAHLVAEADHATARPRRAPLSPTVTHDLSPAWDRPRGAAPACQQARAHPIGRGSGLCRRAEPHGQAPQSRGRHGVSAGRRLSRWGRQRAGRGAPCAARARRQM
jgi:hypothetical protein